MNGLWTKLVALFFTAILGWFFGAYVGSMFSAPVESTIASDPPPPNELVSGAADPGAQSAAALPSATPQPTQPAAVAAATTPSPSPTVQLLLPTVAPTSPPTATPPPGRGTSLEGASFAVQLVDYELRAEGHPENAAVKYVLRFVNTSTQAVRVEMDLTEIKAIDSQGGSYADYFVLANQFAEARCGLPPAAPRYQQKLSIQIPAQGVRQFDFYLGKVGAEGACAAQGTARSRVDASAQLVDLQLARVSYTGDQPRELPSAWWRLAR